MKAQIETDGKTVWVNRASCLARFGVMGIDVHRDILDQGVKGECLLCTHGPVTKKDWGVFKEAVKRFHNITVADKYMPKRFRS